MIICKICEKEFRSITNSHLLHHHMTVDEYARRYGGQLVSYEARSANSKSKKNKKHPSFYDDFDWESLQLGKKPDGIIAKETGINRRVLAGIRKKLGIPPFIGIVLLQEGDPCRSIYEAMYDAYLHWQGVAHQHEVRIKGMPYIADFLIDSCFVEIVGMPDYEKYARKHEQKMAAYEQAGICVQWLSKSDVEELYQKCPVKVKFREQRVCERCGKQTHDLVKNVCRKCYMYVWREENAQEKATCEECGIEFTLPPDRPNQKFCSQKCYGANLEFDWPSWEWIEEQLKTTSIRQLAFRLNIKPPSMYMHLRRRRERNGGKLV